MTATHTSTDTALYLVGLARAGSLMGFEAPGIDPDNDSKAHTVSIHPGGTALDAVVVEVARETFTGEYAEARLQDVAWLRPRAERHESIIRAARERTTIMPVGFGGVFTSTKALEASLGEHTDAITEFFDRTEGCDEWSIKAWVSRKDAIERAKAAIAKDESSRNNAGAAYLMARRLEGEAEILAEDHALDQVERLIEDLGDTIVDAAERRATRVDDDTDRWLIAHVALLIDRNTRAAFDEKLDQLADELDAEGLSLELSGPWSPYSFCPELGRESEEA